MLQRQQEQLARAFNQLSEELQNTMQLLNGYYEEAVERMQNGKYIVNTGIFKELRMYLSQITKIATFAGDGSKLFLLSISRNDEQEMPQPDIDKFIEKYRDCTEIHMSKLHLEQKVISKIRNRCSNVNSVVLVSNTLNLDQVVSDSDLIALKSLSRMSSLSLKNSNITEQGLRILHQQFPGLKELDISGCRFIGNGFRWLSGYKYVSLKANRIENVPQNAILQLVTTSYNLNYLQINDLAKMDYNSLLNQIVLIYLQNKLNFKWLQVHCNAGTILFVNKLAYLTQLTTVDSINDREVEILIGQQPLLDGLYFNCCEKLHSETMNMLIKKCSKLRRLGLRRFINLTDPLLGDLVAALPRLQYLDLSQCCSLTNRALIHLANQLSKLKYISLARCFRIQDEGLLYLIEKMPSLQSIDLSYCKSITDNVVFKICDQLPNLNFLNLTKCDHISNQSIAYLSQKLLDLRALILNGCEGLTDISLSLVAMRLRKLVRLEVEWCEVSQKCVDFIAQNLNCLQVINLNYCHAVCDQALMGLSKYASKLKSLALASCEMVTERGFIRLFGSLKQLRQLDLRQCVGLSDMGIEKLCQTTRGKLVKLDFGWCTNLTDNAILHISQFQHQLLYLSLNGCGEISDNAIIWLSTSARNLQYLNLSLCQRLTDISVFQISKNLSHLRVLFLSELKKLTDVSVSSLAGVQNLEQLHLSGCQQVTSSSLIALLHNLQKLQCLNISECSNIFAESLLLLVQRMRNLTKFSIASLQVSDSFLQMIGDYMQRLQVLNLEYCRKITDQGVLKMVFRVPSLLRIDLQNSCVSEKTKKGIFDQLSTRSLYNVVH